MQGTAGVDRVEVLQSLALELGGAHHETGACGVDETAAVEGDAIGVGQDVVGRAAEDFLRPFDQRGVAADHLVENGRGRLALELRVGRQGTGQFRLPGLGGIVQNHPGAIHVVVEELVMRQSVGVWRDNIDDRDAMPIVDDRCAAGAAGCCKATLGQSGAGPEQGEEDGPAQGVRAGRR